MLTFNISVADHNLPKDIAYQIIPNSRSYLNHSIIEKYSGGSSNCVIHVGYPILPFSSKALDPLSKIPNQLSLYKELAIKLNSKYILIHLPRSLNEFCNFKAGLQLIAKHILSNKITKWNGTVLLETCCFTNDLRKYLSEHSAGSYESVMKVYFDNILPYIEVCKNRVKIILDTAHIYANGCDSFNAYMYTINLCENHLANVIHLNGNVNPIFSSDEHIPFIDYTTKNKLHESFGDKDYKNMIEDAFNRFEIVISENNFEKYPNYGYEAYAEWCTKNNKAIIPSPTVAKYVLSE